MHTSHGKRIRICRAYDAVTRNRVLSSTGSLLYLRSRRGINFFSSSSSSSLSSSSSSSPTSTTTTVITVPTPTLVRSATLALYKSHLQLAKLYDTTYKHCKPLLTLPGLPSPSFSSNDNNLPHIQKLRQEIQNYRNTLLTYSVSSTDSEEERSTVVYQPVRNLTETVRYLYRQQLHKNSLASFSSSSSSSVKVSKDIEIQLDAGFNLLREYSQIINIAQEIEQTKESYLPPVHLSTEESSNNTVDSSASSSSSSSSSNSSRNSSKFILAKDRIYEAAALSPGTLLVDHPAIGAPGRSLILIYDVSQNIKDIHKNEDWMVRGYIINRPFPHTVNDMIKLPTATEEEVLKYRTFGALPIFHGGLEGNNQLSLLHTIKDLEGAVPINEEANCPLYIGGRVDQIIDRIDKKEIVPSQIKVMSGTWESKLIITGTQTNPRTGAIEPILAWPDADLYLQVDGPLAWDIALQTPIFDHEGKYVNPQGLKENVEGYNYARFWHQNITWTYVIQQYGRSIQENSKNELDVLVTKTKDSDGNADNTATTMLTKVKERIEYGKEIESWSKLHAAVVGYARALVPTSPVAYLELYAASIGEEGQTTMETVDSNNNQGDHIRYETSSSDQTNNNNNIIIDVTNSKPSN